MKNLLSRNLLPSVLLICVGLVATLVSLVTLTIARPQTQVNATMDAPTTPYIMTREGVFELSGTQPMTITATAKSDQVVTLVVGRSKDIHAWLGEAPYTEVSGLDSWETLHAEVSDGKLPETEQPNPAKSDMWVEVIQNEGSVTFTTSEATKGMAILATTDGKEPAPQLQLAWTMAASLLWRVTLLVLGLLLTLAGLALLWVFKQKQVGSDQTAQQLAQGKLAGEIVGSSATLDSTDTADITDTAESADSEGDAADETVQSQVTSDEPEDSVAHVAPVPEDSVADTADEDSQATISALENELDLETQPQEPTEMQPASEPTKETQPAAHTREQAEPVHQRTHGDIIETTIGARSVRFPSRQAIKEARLRGESVIEIDGKSFQTGLIPVVKKVKDVAEADLEAE
ncbi:MAG: hypothetical protein Q4D73_05075 [Actinomycetaceae bacterium]|nr:hypothetical protein [Actinomycetaceae bacterium]